MNQTPRKQSESGLFADVWKEYNRLLDYIKEISPKSGFGIRTNRTMNGTVVAISSKNIAAGSFLNQYRLKEVLNDYLRCRSWNGTSEGSTDVYIAKSFRLRRTPFDNLTISFDSDGESYSASYVYSSATKRTVTISGTAEVQIVIPRFKVDFDLIYAMEVEESTGLVNSAGKAITIIDINADGRAWAKQ